LLRGSFTALALLTTCAFLVVIFGTLIIALVNIDIGVTDHSVLNFGWEVLLRAISPDQLTGQDNWPSRLTLLGITVFGLFLFSTLISISNSTIERRIERLRRGRRRVKLDGHLAILNWNQFGPKIIREIIDSTEVDSQPISICILCDEDPIELIAEISVFVTEVCTDRADKPRWGKHPGKWIVIRRGKPNHTDDISNLCAIDSAMAAIVLHEEEDDDSQVVRIVLAINAALKKSKPKSGPQIDLPVISFNSNSNLAYLLDQRLTSIAISEVDAGHRQINYIPLSPQKIRTGIETQVARHRGLSAVYQDLLNFGGNEIYLIPGESFAGTFGDLFEALDAGIPIATISNGAVDFWPNWTERLENKTIVILAANRQDALRTTPTKDDLRLDIRIAGRPKPSTAENFLFVGWNECAEELRQTLDKILPVGSKLTVIRRLQEMQPLDLSFCGQSMQIFGRGSNDPLDDQSFLAAFNHVVVFADNDVTPQLSDAQVLTDLLALRKHANQVEDPRSRFTIVAELRRRSSRHIAGINLADDLLVSDSLMAAAATQLAIQPQLEPVLDGFLSSTQPVEIITSRLDSFHWFDKETELDWKHAKRLIAQTFGEIAIGFRRQNGSSPFVSLNPPNNESMVASDEVVLISQSIGE